MDALKQQLLKVQQQLAGLSASQKMLTASLLVIMVMTLFYWSNVAGRNEMAAVNEAPLSGADLAALQNAVAAKGIKYEVRDGKVWVPTARSDEAASVMGQLAYDGSLPPAALTKVEDDSDSNFFFGDAVRESRAQEKRRKRVENMIARWPGVRSAQVIIVGQRQNGIMHDTAPTSSVSIETKGDVDAKKLFQSSRKLVVGAQPGLKLEDVKVIINGQSFDGDDPNMPFGGPEGQLLARKSNETYLRETLLQQLRFIPGVRATVVVNLNTSDVTTNERTVEPKNVVTAVQHETTTEESTPTPPTNGEPGATTNLTVDASAPSAAEQPPATKNMRERTNVVQIGGKETWTKKSGGDASAATAVVSVPESYFRKIWAAKNAAAKREPKEEEVASTVKEYLPRIRDTARLAVNIPDEKNVQVSTYFDLEDPTPVADPTAGAGLAALPTGSGFGAKEIAVAALAVISLFMVSMMVRKSAPQPVLAGVGAMAAAGPASATDPIPDSSTLLTVGDVIGEVSESNLTMAGHELAPEEIESKQVIEQVGTMVKANPDIAANLVKRWLNQD